MNVDVPVWRHAFLYGFLVLFYFFPNDTLIAKKACELVKMVIDYTVLENVLRASAFIQRCG